MTPPVPRETVRVSRVHRLYFALERWANAGWANSVVFLWGILQGTCIPGFVDLFFLPLALAHPRRAYTLALASAAGTMIGSVALYWIGVTALGSVSGPMASWLGVGPGELAHMHTLLDRYGWLAIFASTLSPLSTKLTSVASGAFAVPWPAFVVALGAGRLLRVMAFAYLVQHGGASWVARRLKVPKVPATAPQPS